MNPDTRPRPVSNGASIQEISSTIKRSISRNDAALTLLIMAVSLISFWLGRQSMGEGEAVAQKQQGVVLIEGSAPPAPNPVPLPVNTPEELPPPASTVADQVAAPTAAYVASKSGTKYHLPWCSGAKSIKEENKIWFSTKEEAEAAGYTPAANCKGI